MCNYWCGDPERQHSDPDGIIVYCRDCAAKVSDDFHPFRNDDWADHVEFTPGEHHRIDNEEGEQLDTQKPVGGFKVGDLVDGDDTAGGHVRGARITGFSILGDQGFIATLDKTDDHGTGAFYIEDLSLAEED